MNDQPYSLLVVHETEADIPKRPTRAETPPKLLISAVVFGVLFSWLFVNQEPGLNLAVFVLLVYGFAGYNRALFVRRTFRQEPLIYLFTVPVVFLSVYFFAADTLLNVLSVLVIMLVMFVQYVVISGNALYSWDQPGFFVDLVFAAVNRVIMALGLFLSGVFRRLFKERSSRKTGVLIGIGVGFVLLLIIVPILALSDPLVSTLLSGFFVQINIGDAFLYVFMFLLGATLITAPVASAKAEELSGLRRVRENVQKRPVQGVTVGVALTMLSVVYVLFAVVQFSYFFLPYQTLKWVLGLTSSAYAVRGFGELMVVTCINFVVIAVTLRFSALKNGRLPIYLKVLLTLLVVFNFVIMASSHLRMQCYETYFGYTVMRFLPHSFMALLLILNVIMLARIYSDKVKAFRLFAVAALCYFCVIVAVNPERWVTRANVNRYEQAVQTGQAGEIDTEYLLSLSANALPDACTFVEEHPEQLTQGVQDIAKSRLESFYWTEKNSGWQSLNISRQQAITSLESLLQ